MNRDDLVQLEIDNKERLEMDSFAILFDSFECNRCCPYCIAKNDQKFDFSSEENYENLDQLFQKFRDERLYFKRVVFFGNGEPTLYPFVTLKKCFDSIIKYKDIFGELEYYTSGLIFEDVEKFNLINNSIKHGLKSTFVICMVSLDFEKDKEILGQKNIYFNEQFETAHNIKLSLCLTSFLNLQTLRQDLIDIATKYPNIKTFYFKKLRPGSRETTSQYKWVKKYAFTKDQVLEAKPMITQIFDSTQILSDKNLKYDSPKEGRRHLVFAQGKLCDFEENVIEVEDIRKKVLKKEFGLYV